MAATPKSTVWAMEPHTRAKHEILGRYLEAWTAILSLGKFPTIAYVDGFAGPGVYENGEIGSPIIALNAALEQQRQHPAMKRTKLIFLFIEQKKDRAERLQESIAARQLPPNFHVKVVGERSFEAGFREYLGTRGKPLPPTFAFIDPFGWTGVPFGLVKEILGFNSCEVLFNFMYEEINRFIEHPDQGKNFDSLFGTDKWRGVATVEDSRTARRAFLHDLYVRQLREEAGARFVRSFEMANKNDATDYFLFFATNSTKGIEKMKEAMWKVDESGAFRFSDATAGAQLALPFTAEPDFTVLRRAIVDRFGGKITTVGEVEEFVLADTPFRETHYKKQVLADLERERLVVAIDPKPGRRAGTYSDPEMKLRFAQATLSLL